MAPLNFRFATRESHSGLHEFIVLEKGVRRPRDGFFLRAESFYNVATEIEGLGVLRSYEGLGYSFIEYVQWDLEIVNYRSVILSKGLG